jgi:hypothetical protein
MFRAPLAHPQEALHEHSFGGVACFNYLLKALNVRHGTCHHRDVHYATPTKTVFV